MKNKLILDVDGVLINFVQGMIDFGKQSPLWSADFPDSPEDIKGWDFFPKGLWKDVASNEDFWMNLKPLDQANKKLRVKPFMYMTARPIRSDVTRESLWVNGFPESAIMTVKSPLDKVKLVLSFNGTLVDDHWQTVKAVIEAGGNALLYKAHYQQFYQEEIKGLPVISSMEEINERFGE